MFLTVLLIVEFLSMIVYFALFRYMYKNEIIDEIDELSSVIGLIILAFIPIINVIVLLIVFAIYFYEEIELDLEPNKILKKILFIKDDNDDEDSFKRERYR